MGKKINISKNDLNDLINIQKLTYADIGKIYNITGGGVKKIAKRLGIKLTQKRKINSNENFNKGISKKIIHPCINCGNETTNEKFCSKICCSTYKNKEWIVMWKNGTRSGISKDGGISSGIRKYLFNKYDNKCARCGWNEINIHTGKIPLEVEHIDGNYRNNAEDNLTLLCPNCHSLTSTYKGANLGHGRTMRKK